ncbi:FAD-dependent oxidoreductase [Streptodolium elevatio]
MRIVVVGGGVLGTMHAWQAVRRGHDVVHLEREREARGASVRNFGLVWVGGRAGGDELRTAVRARELWERIGAEVPGVGFRSAGSLTVCRNADELAVAEAALALPEATERGLKVLDPTKWIVIAAHAVLVVAFAYATVSAGLDRTDRAFADVAASLGASPLRVLLRIRLPMLLPSVSAAASLSLALSMGEVGATVMIYPADWRTLPVSVFTLTDRGKVLLGSAVTPTLILATLVLLIAVGMLKGRVEESRK